MSAVQYRRYFSLVTQAAARTFALRLAELGVEFKRGLHDLLQLNVKPSRAVSRPSTARQPKLRQSMYSELTDSSSLMRRIVSASNPDTLNWRILAQAFAAADS